MAQQPTPVSAKDRIVSLDIVRGVAVLMIFVVNVKGMGAPSVYHLSADMWASPLDQNLARLQLLLVDNKFIALFTALFGAGLAIFCDRAAAKGAGGGLVWRRLAALLAIGLAHGCLIWGGDILALYACVGALAVLFVRASPVTLYASAVALVAAQFAFKGLADAHIVAASVRDLFTGAYDPSASAIATETAAYLGGVGDQLARRAPVFGARLVAMLGSIGPQTLAIMLVGMALHRQGFFALAWSARRTLWLAAPALLGFTALRAALGLFVTDAMAPAAVLGALHFVADAGMAFGYAAAIVLAVKIGLRVPPLAAAGRMALTNYIACSLIGTTLFYGHAGGLYGSMSLAWMMGVVVLTWAAILVWSPLWLARYRFGPLEWAWRSLTYGDLQPLRRPEAPRDGALI